MGEVRSLRTLATDVNALIRSERKAVRVMEPSDVLVRSTFVAYKADDRNAKAQAERILQGAMLRKKWQFWR
jgi:hypothetical protein